MTIDDEEEKKHYFTLLPDILTITKQCNVSKLGTKEQEYNLSGAKCTN